MNADAERTLNNLNVLAAISHNDKLMTNDDTFDIYSPTTFRAIYRTWYGERRTQNIERVRQTVRAGITHASSLLEESTQLMDSQQELGLKLKVHTIAMHSVRLVDALENATKGLTNLTQTYRDDAALASQIRLITVEIKDFLVVVKPHISVLREKVAVSISEASPPTSPPSYRSSPHRRHRVSPVRLHPPPSHESETSHPDANAE